MYYVYEVKFKGGLREQLRVERDPALGSNTPKKFMSTLARGAGNGAEFVFASLGVVGGDHGFFSENVTKSLLHKTQRQLSSEVAGRYKVYPKNSLSLDDIEILAYYNVSFKEGEALLVDNNNRFEERNSESEEKMGQYYINPHYYVVSKMPPEKVLEQGIEAEGNVQLFPTQEMAKRCLENAYREELKKFKKSLEAFKNFKKDLESFKSMENGGLLENEDAPKPKESP